LVLLENKYDCCVDVGVVDAEVREDELWSEDGIANGEESVDDTEDAVVEVMLRLLLRTLVLSEGLMDDDFFAFESLTNERILEANFEGNNLCRTLFLLSG
jgi:hypothetical protein